MSAPTPPGQVFSAYSSLEQDLSYNLLRTLSLLKFLKLPGSSELPSSLQQEMLQFQWTPNTTHE